MLQKCMQLAQQKNFAGAEKQLSRLLKFNPDNFQARLLLARLFQQQQRIPEAIKQFRHCLRLQPAQVEVLINLGVCLKAVGQLQQALDIYDQALPVAGHIPELHNNRGNVLRATGDFAAAERAYQQATGANTDFAGAWHNLGSLYLEMANPPAAWQPLARAWQLEPDSRRILSDLADCISLLPLDTPEQQLEAALLACLQIDRIDGRRLSRAAARYLRQHVFGQLTTVDATNVRQLLQPVLLCLLVREPVCDIALERLLTQARRWLLLTPDKDLDAELQTLLVYIARQCFLNEYVWSVSDEESALVDELTSRISNYFNQDNTATAGCSMDLCRLACYRPLSKLDISRKWIDSQSSSMLAPLLTQQILEPLQENSYSRKIEILSTINDSTSAAVQNQYEENPYPRWQMQDQPEPTHLSAYVQALFPWLTGSNTKLNIPESPAILSAGCGTGLQAIRLARRFPDARITAIDLSRSSLAYAVRRYNENQPPASAGTQAIKFCQADILQLDKLQDHFDMIECYGVLHHMQDPRQGWQSLRQKLKPEGLMRIGLYSERARGPIRAIRAYIDSNKLTADHAGIRQCREYVACLPADDPCHVLLYSPDFYSTSECRDLMFHVQEHQLTLTGIKEILDALRLEFIGFEFSEFSIPQRYKNEYPDDPLMRNLDNWDIFEQKYTDTFSDQYIFWVRALA